MKTILVIQGHPSKDSLCASLARVYFAEAEKSGFQVKLLELTDLQFDLSLYGGFKSKQIFEPDLALAQKFILEANHLVFVFPIWWETMPALLKGFIDRTFLPGFAFKYRENSPFPEKLLKNKSARIIATLDSPPWYYKWFRNASGLNSLKRGTLEFCGINPVKSTLIGPVRKAPKEKIEKFFNTVKELGNKGT